MIRHAAAALLFAVSACKTGSTASEAKDDAASFALATPPPLAAAGSGSAPSSVSLNGLLARNGISGVRLVPTPLVRQARFFTGGAAALQSVLAYWGEDFREGSLARLLKAGTGGGTSYMEMVKLVEQLNDPAQRPVLYAALATDEEALAAKAATQAKSRAAAAPGKYVIELHAGLAKQNRTYNDAGEASVPKDGLSSHELELLIEKGRPVIVMIQAWTDKTPPNWGDDTTHGHYVVVVGFDKERFYFMDPATAGDYTYIKRREFLERWHDVDAAHGPMRHFALAIYQDKPGFDLDNVLPLK